MPLSFTADEDGFMSLLSVQTTSVWQLVKTFYLFGG